MVFKPKNCVFQIASVCAFVFFLAGSGVWAAQDSVQVSFAEQGFYNLDTQVFTGEGDVVITYGDVVLKGQKVTWDVKSGELILNEKVSLRRDELEMFGESLVYNLKTEEGVFSPARAEMELAAGTGSAFFRGAEVDLESEYFKIKDASVTTCDFEPSHYRVAVSELEVFVDDRAILRGVIYYEGKIPLFYWPYLVISLDSERDQTFSLPVLGYSEKEGYFIKNTFNYYWTDKAYGHIYVDLFTKLGLGLGVRHFYDLNKAGKGSLYLYSLPFQTKDLQATWKHDLEWGNWSVRTSNSFISAGVKETISTDTTIRFSGSEARASARNYYKKTGTAIEYSRELSGSWQKRLGQNWHLKLEASYKDVKKERLLDYLAETVYTKDKHTLTLAVEQKYNPDLMENVPLPYRTVQRLPELKWGVSDLGLANLPLSSQVELGRYTELPSGLTKTRALGQLNLRSKSWRPIRGLTLTYQGEAGGAFYGQPDWQSWLYGRITLNQRLFDRLQLSGTYSQREVWGNSPFEFDKKRAIQDLTLRLSYSNPTWQLSLGSGYNFRSKKFNTLSLQAFWRPDSKWSLNLLGYYNLNDRSLTNIVSTVLYKSGEIDLKLGAHYDFISKNWGRLDAKLELPLGETWKISYDAVYESLKGTFTRGRLTIAKDLHCRELNVSYDQVSKRVALEYKIKAFPTLPLGWDSDEGVSLFDMDEVAEIIGVKE